MLPAGRSDISDSSDNGGISVVDAGDGLTAVDADRAAPDRASDEAHDDAEPPATDRPDDTAAETDESPEPTAPVMNEAAAEPAPLAPPAPQGPAAAPAPEADPTPAVTPLPASVPPPRAALDDLRGPTVDLQSHLNATRADPDSTAVLDVPTADLSGRVDRPEDSVRGR
jgi:hypothetical protein